MSKRKNNFENNNDYNNWTCKLLTDELRKRKLKKSGKKAELIQRLRNDDDKRKSNNLNNRNDLTSSSKLEYKMKLFSTTEPEKRARLFMSYHNYNIIYIIKVNNSIEKYRYFILIEDKPSFICGYCGSKTKLIQKDPEEGILCEYGEYYSCKTYNRKIRGKKRWECQDRDPSSDVTACKLKKAQFEKLLESNYIFEISKEEEEKVEDIQEETKEDDWNDISTQISKPETVSVSTQTQFKSENITLKRAVLNLKYVFNSLIDKILELT